MSKSMIVAPQPDAVEAGARVLREGGNAIDAAIACAFVQGVIDPLMCGIAGFGSFQILCRARGTHEVIDFHGKVPLKATPDMWADLVEGETRDGFGFAVRGNVNDVGYQSTTTPGALKALNEAHQRYGTRSWPELIEPAIAFAEEGFLLAPHVYHFWVAPDLPGRVTIVDRLRHTPAARRLFFDASGELRKIGSRITRPELGRTLRRIAAEGPAVFYEGEIAHRIDRDMAEHGGLLSLDDLRSYRTTRTEPLWGEYRGHRVSSCQPPGGGVVLLQMLHILDRFDLASLGHNTPEYIAVIAEAMKIATADKERYVGDPAFVEVPVARLLSKAYADEKAAEIRAGKKAAVERFRPPESPHTSHISVFDGSGNAVSLTHSLGMMSGVITDDLGFMYNGCMGVFDPRPGRTGSIAPGKSRFSSICPSIVFRGQEPYLILGAPGGTQIAMGVLQVILNVIDFGMPITEAVIAPRFSATSDAVDVSARTPQYLCDEVEKRGYRVIRSPISYYFAGVHAILAEDGLLSGAADPAWGAGMALEV